VTLDPSCLEAYHKLKIKSPKDLKSTKDRPEEYKYIIFNLNEDNTQIIVEKIALQVKSDEKDEFAAERVFYENFLESLPETECRWAVYDLVYEKEGGTRKKLVLFSW
jgi:cofilin